MIEHSPSILAFLKQLQRVPYLASKNMYVVAQHFLDLDRQSTEKFIEVLRDLKEHVDKCTSCWSWKEKEQDCKFCTSAKRDAHTICVVETWRDLIAIEKTGGYAGRYHVLGGALCPLDGIGPDDLTIKQLVARVEHGCKELIFAFNQTPEGEATAAFISSKLRGKEIKITCLARGLPVGSSLESMDRLTVYKALSERRIF
jgi:recombination protein RecR